MPLPLAKARDIAQKIASELYPFCDQIEIAGSIRRGRPMVNDIDLVVLPKAGRAMALRERCKRNATRVQADGEMTLVLRFPFPLAGPGGLQLDVWFAHPATSDLFSSTPTNFGSLLLCRTGSKEHNTYLLSVAERLGYRWNPYYGVFDGHRRCLASATEEEIFQALKMPFVRPEEREK